MDTPSRARSEESIKMDRPIRIDRQTNKMNGLIRIGRQNDKMDRLIRIDRWTS